MWNEYVLMILIMGCVWLGGWFGHKYGRHGGPIYVILIYVIYLLFWFYPVDRHG